MSMVMNHVKCGPDDALQITNIELREKFIELVKLISSEISDIDSCKKAKKLLRELLRNTAICRDKAVFAKTEEFLERYEILFDKYNSSEEAYDTCSQYEKSIIDRPMLYLAEAIYSDCGEDAYNLAKYIKVMVDEDS